MNEVLNRAREEGFLGPRPVEAHIRHAHGFAAGVDAPPALAVDLGSGGGVPGLALAVLWPASRWVLVDASSRRVAHLRWAVDQLDLQDRVVVRHDRAELIGRGALRGRCDLVTARSFAGPGITAECAAPLLCVGGVLVVSEPPEETPRWEPAGLTELGLAAPRRYRAEDAWYVAMRLERLASDRYPRRVGIPAKRPLF